MCIQPCACSAMPTKCTLQEQLDRALHHITTTVPCAHYSRWAWHVGRILQINSCLHCGLASTTVHATPHYASKTVPLNIQHLSDSSAVFEHS
jgi:hypothetical protein